jgi:hypothetical protein
MGESYGKKVKIAIERAQTQQPISHITQRMKNSQEPNRVRSQK